MKKSILSNLKNKKIVAFTLAFAMIVAAGIFMIPEALKVEASGDTVADGMLDVKMQVQDVGDTLNMRLVSSVNGLGYSKVGFEVIFDKDGDGELSDEEKIVHTAYSVLEHINASKTGVTYDYSPKVIDEDAEYFITGTLMGIKEAYRSHVFYVRAYATSYDGSETTYGAGRYFTIDDADNSAIINIPVKMDSLPEGVTIGAADALSVTVGDTSTTATVLALRDGYAQLNIKIADKTALKSASLVIANGEKTIYRNLESSKAVVGADDSWYTVYNQLDPNQKKFVIVTDADLYGLGTKSQSHTFAEQEIYVVADIAANTGDASTWSESNQPTNVWTPIGATSVAFDGKFDGCGHTISGVYGYTTTEMYLGLFRKLTGTIENMQLTNSYFYSSASGTCDAGAGSGMSSVGAIAGYTDEGAIIRNVYNEATVMTKGHRAAGFVGVNRNTLTIENCWNAGNVTSGKQYAAGFIAAAAKDGKPTITNCLNTGYIEATEYSVAGFVAFAWDASVNITIQDCLNAGTIETNHPNVPRYGAYIGMLYSGAKATISNSYMVEGSCLYNGVTCNAVVGFTNSGTGSGNLNGTTIGQGDSCVYVDSTAVNTGVSAYVKDKILGIGGGIYTDLDFENYWAAVKGKTPELKMWATGTEVAVNDEMRLDDSWTETNTITTVGQLYDFVEKSQTNNYSGQTISLGKDITVNAGLESEWDGTEYKWQPIGSASALFAGTFDGNGHTLSGLYGYTTTDMNLGLFRYLQGTIKNLRLENSYFYSSAQGTSSDGGDITASEVGAIVGATRDGAVIQNVYTNATVYATGNRAAGFVGGNRGKLTIENCWNAGNITVAGDNRQQAAGFIASSALDGQPIIKNCLNTGKINAVTAAGAFVSFAWGKGNPITITITDSLSAGTVTASNKVSRCGAYIGMLYGGATANITNSYVLDEVCNGAIIGYTNGTSLNGEAFNLNDTNRVYANSNDNTGVSCCTTDQLSGFNAAINTGLNFTTVWSAMKDGIPQLSQWAIGTKWNVDGIQKADTSWYDGSATIYEIDTVGELYGLALLSQTEDFAGETIKLGANLTVKTSDSSTWGTTDYNWIPIGTASTPFAGTFDGDGYTISGLYGYTNREFYLGFIRKLTGTVQNLKLMNSSFKSEYKANDGTGGGNVTNVGAIAGWAGGTIQNVYSEATVYGNGSRVGGFAGYCNSTLAIINCWNKGEVTGGDSAVGGFLGAAWVNANISFNNCLNSGNVKAAYHIGGYVGQAYGSGCRVSIEDCVNTGTITATGGTKRNSSLIGVLNGSASLTVSDTYATTESTSFGAVGLVSGATVNGTAVSGNWQPAYYENTANQTNKVSGAYEVAEATLKSDAQAATSKLDWNTYWKVGTDGLPALKQIEWK